MGGAAEPAQWPAAQNCHTSQDESEQHVCAQAAAVETPEMGPAAVRGVSKVRLALLALVELLKGHQSHKSVALDAPSPIHCWLSYDTLKYVDGFVQVARGARGGGRPDPG